MSLAQDAAGNWTITNPDQDPILQWLNNTNNATDFSSAYNHLTTSESLDPSQAAAYLNVTTNKSVNPNAGSSAGGGGTPNPNGLNLTSGLQIPNTIGSGVQIGNMFKGANPAQQALAQANMQLNNAEQAVTADQASLAPIQPYEDGVYWNSQTGEFVDASQVDPLTQQLGVDQAAVQADQQAIQTAQGKVFQSQVKQGGIRGFLSSHPLLNGIASTIAAGLANYELFSEVEQETYNTTTGGGLKAFAAFAAAFFATVWWLVAVWHRPNPFGVGFLAGCWHTVAEALGIVSAVVAAAVIAGTRSSEGPLTSTGANVKAMLKQIPSIFTTLPKSAVALMAGGLAIGGMTYSLPTGSSYSIFSVPTSQLSSAVDAATGQSGSLGKILYQQGSGPNGSNTVILTYPGANGNTQGIEFNVDSNGFLVDANGNPQTSYKPFAQPLVDSHGNVTGVKMNPGAFEALLQVPGCLAIANDTSLTADQREAALETCLRNDKDVQFIPGI